MQILSAFDAISPATARTKLVLFTPFRVGRTWKLAASSYLSVIGGVFFPVPLFLLAFFPVFRSQGQGIAAIVIAFAAVGTLLYLALFYVLSRLRFAMLDVIVNRGQRLAPAWRKYGGRCLPWTLLKVVAGTVFFAILALPLLHVFRGFPALLQSVNVTPGAPPSPEMMHAFFSIYASLLVFYVVFGLFYLLSSITADFVIPSLALEGTSLGEAFARFGRLIRNEPGQVAIYSLLKVGLIFAGLMAVGVGFYIVLFVFALVLVVVGGIIGLLLHLLHVPLAVLWGLAAVAGVLAYLVFFFYFVLITNGTLFTFLEAYGLYFLGGRYPMLGALLDQSSPPPVVAAPAYPPYAPPTA